MQMKYLFLLCAGAIASTVHAYLVWRHRDNRKYSISEHAILDRQSHLLYFVSHIVCEVLILLYAYQFFLVEQDFLAAFYLLVIFAVLDFIQAALPSKGRTEKIHFVSAYVSWVCYLLAGIVALFGLELNMLYTLAAAMLYVPILAMFAYMHVNRSKLYPYQLLMVPLYVVCMLFVTLGAE